MTKKYIIANWKMHGGKNFIDNFFAVWPLSFSCDPKVVICPAFIDLDYLRHYMNYGFSLGAQNCSYMDEGAFTGQVSPKMLRERGCKYCIIGHSEIRRVAQEKFFKIKEKIALLMQHNITPIICIGETKKEHDEGQTLPVLTRQLKEAFDDKFFENIKASQKIMVAYEPLWAIGTAITPEKSILKPIYQKLHDLYPQVSFLYGGSVNEKNIEDFLSIPFVSGALIGSASLKAEGFKKIIETVYGKTKIN